MARTKLNPEFEIEVEGEPYVWRLQRQPFEAGKAADRRGMAIAVRHAAGQREAVIEFPPGPQRKIGAPQFNPFDIPAPLVARAIASAVAAGWNPWSRGRKVEIMVDATGA